MSRPAVITLTTDFGVDSPYVAAMKGVILSINPAANIVDITHSVPPQDVRRGALVLDEATPWFPDGTIHVAVVDPGVGSSRRIVYARFGEQQYIAPDNGLLSRLALRGPASRMISLEAPEFWLPRVSATFHGRDIMAPAAARLSLGLPAERLGPPTTDFVKLVWPEVVILPRTIKGSVESIDSFGNLVTDITEQKLAEAPRDERVRIACDEHETLGIFRTYSDQPPATLMALIGSHGKLELAIVGESAAAMLGIRTGTPVKVSW
ncbi:MAG TPA: SAM-dependent chlorinase/fluorinase [Pirellulales bacterium]|nr:SAM-dependent chlorinase/fluorinase [Pirellulales bacterium]